MRRFTLIELLVVIAILGILLTLLLPSLEASRAKARVAVCASQIKQISYALFSYTSHNNGFVPVNHTLGNGKEHTWDDYLVNYDGRELPQSQIDGWIPHSQNNLQYICPADKSEYHSVRHKRSYSLTHGTSGGVNTKRGIVHTTNSPDWSINLKVINETSSTIALVENHQSRNKLGCNSGEAIRIKTYQNNQTSDSFWGHGKWRGNYLFIDGSVGFISAQQTFMGIRSIWGSENQIDTMWDSRK